MATLTPAQAGTYAAQAGFSGESLATIVAIAQAESGLVTNQRHANADGSIDRGILQINSFWHAEYSDAVCDDPAQAFAAGWKISSGGTNFAQWTTYDTGVYQSTPEWQTWKAYLAKGGSPAQFTFSGNGATPSAPKPIAWTPALAQKVWPWLTHDGQTIIQPVNPWHSSFEASRGANQDGIGIPVTPFDTPITSLTRGTIMAAAFGTDFDPSWQYGGFIIVRSTIQGVGTVDVFYRHMDVIQVKKGDTVKVGQLLGLSGGQNSGGSNPESTTFSTGPHIDIGINPVTLPYQAIGPNMNPQQWVQNLITYGPPATDKAEILVNGTAIGGVVSGATSTLTGIEQASQGTGPAATSFLAVEIDLNEAMFMFPFRTGSTQLGNPVHNWPVVGGVVSIVETPFQGAIDVASFLGGTVDWLNNNIVPMFIRLFFVMAGLLILAAFIFAMFKASGAGAAVEQGAKVAAMAA